MATLYCPTCGYNLTGLPENRCPECGEKFDPAKIENMADYPPPLSVLGAITKILILPALLWLTILLGVFWPESEELTCSVAIFQLLGGLLASIYLAKRVVVNQAIREKRVLWPEQARPAIARWTLFLYLMQLSLGAGLVLFLVLWSLFG